MQRSQPFSRKEIGGAEPEPGRLTSVDTLWATLQDVQHVILRKLHLGLLRLTWLVVSSSPLNISLQG